MMTESRLTHLSWSYALLFGGVSNRLCPRIAVCPIILPSLYLAPDNKIIAAPFYYFLLKFLFRALGFRRLLSKTSTGTHPEL